MASTYWVFRIMPALSCLEVACLCWWVAFGFVGIHTFRPHSVSRMVAHSETEDGDSFFQLDSLVRDRHDFAADVDCFAVD
jgi:hypothetical protein